MLDTVNLFQTITVFSIASEETSSVCCHFACFKDKEMDKRVFRKKIKAVWSHMVISFFFISILPSEYSLSFPYSDQSPAQRLSKEVWRPASSEVSLRAWRQLPLSLLPSLLLPLPSKTPLGRRSLTFPWQTEIFNILETFLPAPNSSLSIQSFKLALSQIFPLLQPHSRHSNRPPAPSPKLL